MKNNGNSKSIDLFVSIKEALEERDLGLFTAASQRLEQSLAHKTSITMSL